MIEHETAEWTREDDLTILRYLMDHTPEQRARCAEQIATSMQKTFPSGDHNAQDILFRGIQDDVRDVAIAALNLSEAPPRWDGCPFWVDTLACHLAEEF